MSLNINIFSQISGLTLVAVPADVYLHGASYALIVPSLIIVCLGILYIYLPVFFKMQCTSTFEYLNKRFDYKCRMLGSFLFALTMMVYLPIVVYIPALAFSAGKNDRKLVIDGDGEVVFSFSYWS